MSTQPTRIQPKRRSATLSSDRVLNSASPIGKAETDLQPFFHACINDWDTLYTEEEKRTIISKLPPTYQSIELDQDGRIKCPLSLGLPGNDTFFKDSLARFQRDVSDGYWTATWRSNATKASEERSRGKFDDYLKQYAEETFGNGGGQISADLDEVHSSDGDFSTRDGSRSKNQNTKGKKQRGDQNGRSRRLNAEALNIGMDEMHGD